MAGAEIDAGGARSETCENFVADGSGETGCIVYREMRADQLDETAPLSARLRQIGDVENGKVHGNAAQDRQGASVEPADGAALAVARAELAEIAVGIADRDGSVARAPLKLQAGAVADRFSRIRLPDLHDTAVKAHHRGHWIGTRREGIAAIEGDTRTDQIEVELGAEENPGGIGETQGRAPELRAEFSEIRSLGGIFRVFGSVGAGEVAHDQAEAETVHELAIGKQMALFLGLEPEPVHAGVDVNCGGPLVALSAAERRPFLDLGDAAEHRPETMRLEMPAGTGEQAVERVDGRFRQGRAQRFRFARRRDEKAPAALRRQGSSRLCRADTVAVAFHDGGAFCR